MLLSHTENFYCRIFLHNCPPDYATVFGSGISQQAVWYFLDCTTKWLLTHMLDWIHHGKNKFWVTIEKHFSPILLAFCPIDTTPNLPHSFHCSFRDYNPLLKAWNSIL